MNPQATPSKSGMSFLHGFLLLVSTATLCGCAIVKMPFEVVDGLAGTNLMAKNKPVPPAPPPRANWIATQGFSAATIPKLAIIIEDGDQPSWRGADPFLTSLEDQFMQRALQKGYKIAARSDVEGVMKEIRFQRSGLTEGDAARLGRLLNVPAVLIVKIAGTGVEATDTNRIINNQRVYEYTAWCNMSVRLISVERAEVLGLCSFFARESTNRDNNAGPAMYLAATTIAAALPSRN